MSKPCDRCCWETSFEWLLLHSTSGLLFLVAEQDHSEELVTLEEPALEVEVKHEAKSLSEEVAFHAATNLYTCSFCSDTFTDQCALISHETGHFTHEVRGSF